MRLSKFRTSDRDRQSDTVRFDPIRSAIRSAIASLDQETAGLKPRVLEAQARLGAIMGNEDGSYFERDEQLESELKEAEQELKAGTSRLQTLEGHRNCCLALEKTLAEHMAAASAGVPATP